MNIAIITSGGDSPGMNPCVADLVIRLHGEGHRVIGYRGGYAGILKEDWTELYPCNVQGWHKLGGSVLRAGRLPEMAQADVQDQVIALLEKHDIHVLIVIGGDGSFNGALKLHERSKSLQVIGIPGTIDNNIFGSEYTLGFDTALNKQMCYIDDIMDTAMALPGRVFFVETLGAWDGYLAQSSVRMMMADFSVLVERPMSNAEICEKIRALMLEQNKDYVIVTFAEGTYQTQEAAEYVAEQLGLKVKVNLLGYAQRGGSPTAMERLHASGFADFAVEMVRTNRYNKYIVFAKGAYHEMDLSMASRKKEFNW